jgi:hypothetical protein
LPLPELLGVGADDSSQLRRRAPALTAPSLLPVHRLASNRGRVRDDRRINFLPWEEEEEAMGVTMTARRVRADLVTNAEPVEIGDMLRSGQPGVVDLDKAWDGIAWLISEERREREYMLPDPSDLETQAIYSVEHTGPYCWTPPERVKQIAEVLAPLGDDALRARYQPEAMTKAGVYPDIWQEEEEEEAFGYLLGYFEELRKLYLEAAATGDGIVHVIE